MIDDLWRQILGDMPVTLQWASAIVGLVVVLLMFAACGFGIEPPRPIRNGYSDEVFTMFGADSMRFIDRMLTPVVNIVFWLVAGPLIAYLTVVLIYITWPWCVLVVVVVAGLIWLIDRWWRRRMGLR